MLTRIELTNFMSHARTVIEPAPGLTVLVGPNNCGKSAVVEALQVLCRNSRKDYMLRHGESECAVLIATDDAHTVEWRRKKRGATSYLVDGQRFDRLGGGVPDEVQQVIRLPQIECDAEGLDIHFGEQKSPIVSLLGSQSAAAKFFASSSDAIRLVEMQKRHKDRLAARQREKNQLEAESKQLTGELDALEPVVGVDNQLRLAEHEHSNLTQADARLLQAERAALLLSEQVQLVARFSEQAAVLSAVTGPPSLLDPQPLVDRIHSMKAVAHDVSCTAATAAALTTLRSPPPLVDTSGLAVLCSDLDRLSRSAQYCAAKDRILGSLPPPAAIQETKPLDRLIGLLATAEHELSYEVNRSSTLGQLAHPPPLDDERHLEVLIASLDAGLQRIASETAILSAVDVLTPPAAPGDVTQLTDLVRHLEALGNEQAAHSEIVWQLTAQLEGVAAEIRELACDSVCPLCGSPLDADRLMQRASPSAEASHG